MPKYNSSVNQVLHMYNLSLTYVILCISEVLFKLNLSITYVQLKYNPSYT